MTEILGHAVNSVISLVDVDGVLRKVDMDEALQRIDMDQLLQRVDMNRLLDRVDFDRVLDRVDFNRVLDRVDVNALVLRSDVGAIMTHSTTGLVGDILDTLRASVVQADVWIYNSMCFVLRRDWSLLPAVPGETARRKKPASENSVSLSTAIQGCFCGIMSKGLAILVDSLLVTCSFAAMLIFVTLGWQTLTKSDNRAEINRQDNRYTLAAYAVYWFMYFWFWTVAVHRTVGMAIVGLKVVDAQSGQSITVTQGLVRTALLPLSAVFAMLLAVVGLLRHDGRMVHDVVAGTGIVYKWNAAMGRFRAHAAEQQRQQQQKQWLEHPDQPLLATATSSSSATMYSSFQEYA